MSVTCEEKFREIYQREPQTAFCPYRVCPLGAHIDHQLGKVHGFALDYGVHIAYGIKKNGIIEFQSLNFPKRVQFHVNTIPIEKEGDWGDYLRGAALELGKKHELRNGICGVVKGALPSGGISSSAALTICFLRALCAANDICLSDSEYIYMAKSAENNYVGVSTGKLDQSCETLCREGSLLSLDCNDDTYINIEASPSLPPFKIGIFFSGIQRSLSKSSAYNNRVDECKAAAFALYTYGVTDRLLSDDSGAVDLEHGLKFKDMYLRYIPKELFTEFGDKLPSSWQKRAKHFYSEMERVEKGLEYWKRGDMVSYGALINESGRSSIENYECGSPELIKLYTVLKDLKGVYGARFSGAGFKGCCMTLIDPAYENSIKETVEREYLKDFPEMEGRYKAYICSTANGVGHADGGKF